MTDPTLVTGLVYNTKAQNLIAKAGNGAGGTIKYGLGTNNTTAPTTWNTSVTGTDAGIRAESACIPVCERRYRCG